MSAHVGTATTSVASTLSGLRNAFRLWLARRREFARITAELEAMSNRELAELGICRSDIPDVARGECYSAYPAN